MTVSIYLSWTCRSKDEFHTDADTHTHWEIHKEANAEQQKHTLLSADKKSAAALIICNGPTLLTPTGKKTTEQRKQEEGRRGEWIMEEWGRQMRVKELVKMRVHLVGVFSCGNCHTNRKRRSKPPSFIVTTGCSFEYTVSGSYTYWGTHWLIDCIIKRVVNCFINPSLLRSGRSFLKWLEIVTCLWLIF